MNPKNQTQSVAHQAIVQELLEWFPSNGRSHLPWRKTGLTAYQVWLSEIMLQQTQVSRVVPYFENMVERFPTVQDLAAATWEEFLPFYQGLGYYSRGRNMLKTAAMVVEKFDGIFPSDPTILQTLPGIGPYTAAAIASFAYGHPHLAFDTNQQRVWGRILHGTKTARVDVTELEHELDTNASYSHLNAAVMDFANVVCTNRSPRCSTCPLQKYCVYFQTNGEREPTTFAKKSTFPMREAQTVVVLHENHKQYFSSVQERFTPFTLPSPLNTRARIKEHFLRVHGLNISVRPPHWKGSVVEIPTQVVTAQVLSGQHRFEPFSVAEYKTWQQDFFASAQEHLE